jgi:hypothetical protein
LPARDGHQTYDDIGSSSSSSSSSSKALENALDELMTAQQVGALLLLPISTVMDYTGRCAAFYIKLGKHRRFVRSQVERTIVELARGSR